MPNWLRHSAFTVAAHLPDRAATITGGAVFAGAALMVSLEEYAAAFVLLAFAFLVFLKEIFSWPVIYPRTRFTTLLSQIIAMAGVAAFLGCFAVIFLRLKGEKHWTRLTRNDLLLLYAYFDVLRSGRAWIILGIAFLLGIAAAVTFIKIRNRKRSYCPDDRIHRTAMNDRHDLSRLVRIYEVMCQPHLAEDGGDGEPYVDFRVSIVNMALVRVEIDNQTRGAIHFYRHRGDEHPLRLNLTPLLDTDFTEPIQFRQQDGFTIKQPVSRAHARHISRDLERGFFRFNDLNVMLRTEGNNPRHGPRLAQLLRTDFDIRPGETKRFECSFVE